MILAFVPVLLALAHSCQEMRLIAQDESVVLGKSLDSDYAAKVDYYLVTKPNGTKYRYGNKWKPGKYFPKCGGTYTGFKFTSLYNITVFMSKIDGKWRNSVKVGMNSAGLAANMQSFANSYFIDRKDVTGEACEKTVPQTKLVIYVLSTYSSVEEIEIALTNKKFPTVFNGGEKNGGTVSAHFSFTDKTGRGLVLEFTKELGMRYYENTVGVMNNGPDYQWHMTNLRNYQWLRRQDWGGHTYTYQGEGYSLEPFWTGTGTSGIPGGYSSPDRFVKATALLDQVETPRNAKEAVVSMVHLLNAANIPKGIITKKDGTLHYTWWITVNDLSSGCLYYRGRMDLSVKRVCLNDIPDEPAFLKVDGNFENGITDIAKGQWSSL